MEDIRRKPESEERSGKSEPADIRRVARDEEPEVEGHRFSSGTEKAAEPSDIRARM